MSLRISLYAMTALLLGAHFLRTGNLTMMALCAAAPLLFLHRKHWILIGLQLLAYCAAGTWISVAIQLVQVRQQLAQSWTVAAMIIGTVALFSAVAGLLLNSRAIKDHYPG